MSHSRKTIFAVLFLSFVVSLIANLGLLYVRRDRWLPTHHEPKETAPLTPDEARKAWTLNVERLQGFAEELQAKDDRLNQESEIISLALQRIEDERQDLERQRAEIQKLLTSLESVFTRFPTEERRNIRTLSKLYAEMSPDAVALAFQQIDESLAAKILSQLPQENAGGVVEAMTRLGGSDAHRAARLTNRIRNLVMEDSN